MPPSSLYLVRHAQSTWNAAGRWQGQADPPLSDLGRDQAAQLALAFPELVDAAILSSDLERARETAAPLARRIGTPVVLEPGLRELDVGSWQGLTRDEIAADDAAALDLYFQGRAGWEGGESYEVHGERCVGVAGRLATVDAAAVVAVTHGGTLRGLLLCLLEISPALRWRFTGIGHTAVTHLRRDRHGWRLVAYNQRLASARGGMLH